MATAQESRDQNYYTAVRKLTNQLWEATQALREKQEQWNALDYGNTLPDGEGANGGLNRVMLGAVVFDTANAFQAVLDGTDGPIGAQAGNMATIL